MKKILLGLLIITVGAAALLFSRARIATTSDEVLPVQESAAQQADEKKKTVAYTVAPGDTFLSVMEKNGVSSDQGLSLLAASSGVYDFKKIKIGNAFSFTFIEDAFAEADYDISDTEMIVAEKQGDGFVVEKKDIPYTVEETAAQGTITSSFFEDGTKAGLEAKTILEVAEILAWDIDFIADIREGDSFKVVYEKRWRDGEPSSAGNVLAAEFTNQNTPYSAFRYEDPNGKTDYYNLEGRSLTRIFLKAPLSYSRISSGFTNARLHPILKIVRPHRAIDYAAPAGTPIISTTEGTVTYAGLRGDAGKFIEIRHDSAYTIQFAHLSGYAKGIKTGAHVAQGQVIGYVGSTGLTTGPHLHYVFLKNGQFVNPLTIQIPPGDMIKEEFRDGFNAARDHLLSFIH